MKIKIIGVGIFSLALILGLWSYSQATNNEITVCVKKNGLVYVIGDGFKRVHCNKNDSLLTWNVLGLKGDKGDKGDIGETGPIGPQGEAGESASHGAGNIAFVTESGGTKYVLKIDGTVWRWSGGYVQITPADGLGKPSFVPVPVEDIVSWNFNVFVDKDGNGWNYAPTPPYWTNVGFPQ